MNSKKLLTSALATIIVSMSMSSCKVNNTSESSNINNSNVSESTTPSEDVSIDNNISFDSPELDVEYKETGTYIFKDGVCDYSIVIPEHAGQKEIQAKDELVDFFKKSTGHTLNVINDREVTYDTNSKYISIGHTKIFEGSGIEVSRDELNRDGFKIKRQGNLLIIVGFNDIGSLYGTYRFMNYSFGFRTYSVDEVYYEKKTEIPLVEFNEVNVPDFDERQLGYYGISDDEIYRDRLHFTVHGENWIYATHSHFQIMPKATYYDKHRDWYSPDGTQLCLTNEEMKAEFIKNVKIKVQSNPEDEYILLGEEDAHTFCTCTRCTEAAEKYGTVSGVDMVFVNSVAEEIENWLKEVDPGRNLKIGTFAYLKTLTPPATYNSETKKWVPNHPDVVARDNVFIFIAPLHANYSYSFLSDENIETKNAFEGWSAITNKFCIWTYSANYFSYFTNFLNFSTQAEQYRELRDLGTESIIDLGPWDTNSPTFQRLRIYLCSRLMWDAELNMDDLIDDFFVHYYKDSYKSMKKYFDMTRTYLEHLRAKYELDALCYVIYNKAEYWPQSYLNNALDLLEKAVEEISYLKEENPALYETLLNRINLESLSPRYYMLRFYQSTFTPEEQTKLIDEFEEIAKNNDVTNWAESTNLTQGDNTIATIIDSWRKNIK